MSLYPVLGYPQRTYILKQRNFIHSAVCRDEHLGLVLDIKSKNKGLTIISFEWRRLDKEDNGTIKESVRDWQGARGGAGTV